MLRIESGPYNYLVLMQLPTPNETSLSGSIGSPVQPHLDSIRLQHAPPITIVGAPVHAEG